MMLEFWLITAILCTAVILYLLRPLLQKTALDSATNLPLDQLAQSALEAEQAADTKQYKQQLKELERQERSGALDTATAQSLQAELARNFLNSQKQAAKLVQQDQQASPMPKLANLLLFTLPAAVIGLYMLIGAPFYQPTFELPAMAQQRLAQRAPEMPQEIKEAVARLEATVKANPDDVGSWIILARAYQQSRHFDKMVWAATELRKAIPDDTMATALLAEALTVQSQDEMPAKARQLWQQVLSEDPAHQMALFFLGLDAFERQDHVTARSYWQKLLDLPAELRDTNWAEMILRLWPDMQEK